VKVRAARSRGVFHVAMNGTANIDWKNIQFKEGLHQFLEIIFPLCTMWLDTMLMFIPGL